MASIVLEARAAAFGWHKKAVVEEISFQLFSGQWLSIIGPNGAGKTTLLHGLAGLLPLQRGAVKILGRDLASYKARVRACKVALMRQSQKPVYPFSVFEIVLQGRYPYGNRPENEEIALLALKKVSAQHLAPRPFSSLSGGERQKVWLARVVAQATPILLLDEPAAHLDPAVKHEIYRFLKKLCREGKAIVCVLHDLTYVSLLSDYVLVLKDGRILAQGKTEEVLVPDTLEEAFGVPFVVSRHPQSGKPLPLPSIGL